MARAARHFVDEALFVIFGKYLAENSKKLLNFVRQPYQLQWSCHVSPKNQHLALSQESPSGAAQCAEQRH